MPLRQIFGWLTALAIGMVFAFAVISGRAVWFLVVPGIALLIWALRSPYRCLLLVLFSFPLERFGTIPTPWFIIKPLQLLAALTLLALLFDRALHRDRGRRPFPRDPVLAFYLVFLVANMVSFAVSGNLDDMRAIFHYLMFALIALLTVWLVRTPEQLSGAVRVLALSGALAAFFGMLQYAGFLSGIDTGIQETRMYYVSGASEALRVTSLYFDPNLFASFLCLVVPLGLACSQAATNRFERGLHAAGVLAMLVSLAFTQSRSGFFGVAAGCVVFLFAQRRLAALGRAVLVVAMLFLLGWTALNLYGSEWYSSEIFLDRVLAVEQGITDRSTAWKEILEAFYDKPVFGVGPAQATNWGVYIPNARSNWDIFNARIVAHNIFVDVAVGSGLLGLVPFVIFVFLLVWRSWRSLRAAAPGFAGWDAGILAALISVLVNSQSITTLLYPFLWCLAGLVVARAQMLQVPEPARPAPVAAPTLAEVRP
ncbi:MAG: O-antigen ligase family protein [Acidobacteria bacterium]|nr:O-antigen ligase family protein [Acidobacteriota bacterium]